MAEAAHLPLFAWADEHPAGAADMGRRLAPGLIVLAAAASIAAIATLALPPRALLLWNASASAPIGLYRVGTAARLRPSDWVIAEIPAAARTLAARRGYLPANVPAVKRVAAVAGDTVCAIGPVVSINGVRVAERRRRDALGRRLPWWEGCATVGPRQVFLLTAEVPGSFDGRYFGPSALDDILGRAHPLCAR